jgi:hypothetical protein
MADPSHPDLVVVVERKHRGGSFAAKTTILSGRISKRWDAGRSLSLAVPNPNGKATNDWHVGDQVRVRLGWGSSHANAWTFDGVIPPRGLRVRGGLPPTLDINAVDGLGLLDREPLTYGDAPIASNPQPFGATAVSWDGWECGAAIKDLLATSQAATAGFISATSAVRSSSPLRWVGPGGHVEPPRSATTRKAVLDLLVAAMVDDETKPDRPRPFHYWMTSDAGGSSSVYLQPERDPDVDPSIRTLSTTSDVLDSDVGLRSDQAVAALVSNDKDPSAFSYYSDDDAVARYALAYVRETMKTTNTDELLDRARRLVAARRYPLRTATLRVRDGFRHEPNQVVTVTNPHYGGSGKFVIASVDLAFGPGGATAELGLSSARELLSEILDRRK